MNRSRSRPISILLVLMALALGLAACSNDGGPASTEGPGITSASAGDPGPVLREEWFWPAPPPASVGMPAADTTGVAFTAGAHRVVLLDPSGAVRWQAERLGVRDVAPLLTPDLVVVAADDGVIAYERANGRMRWHRPLGERANTPVFAGGAAAVTTWEGSLVSLDLADGRVRWRTGLGGDALGPAAGSGPVVVATFDTGRAAGAVAVDAVSGAHRWSVPLPAGGVSAPAVTGGGTGAGGEAVVVVVAGDVAAHGLALDDGAERWRQDLEGAGSPEVPPLALAGDTVLVPHRQGGLALLGTGDGAVRWIAGSDGASVRGGPAGPGPGGWFALPLDDGRLLLAGPDRDPSVFEPPDGLTSGVASGPGGVLLIATAQGSANAISAASGW
ncbi:MAG: PQQ-binding-like beta-propeller repeat protein [Actinobacteria bacterium]|nr:PQQ-binding-like beta-propeller repeat protein [Actinomycetota bacterium]